jgi:hypothetical protein
MPGFGESGPKCGVWYPDAVCDECGDVSMNTHKCGRRSCSNCFGIWAKEASVRGTERIQSLRYVSEFKQSAHASLSPTEGEIRTKRQFFQGKKKAAEKAREKGFRGFAVIGHPWRPTEEAKAMYRAVDPDVGIWVWLREEFTESEMKELIHWSPHYHIIGCTTPDMDPASESDEWVYTFHRSHKAIGGAADKEAHSDVYGNFRYLLSHTGWPEGSTKQAVTWYGDLANSVFVEDASEEWQVQKPSEGVRAAIRRHTEEVAGVDLEEEGDGAGVDDGRDDLGDCPDVECGGVLIDVLDVDRYLRHNDPPPDVAKVMKTCFDWRLGRLHPPPGLRRPKTEEDARGVLDHLL